MMAIENIQEFYISLVLGTFLFVHGLHAGLQVAKVAGPRNHWPGQARPMFLP